MPATLTPEDHAGLTTAILEALEAREGMRAEDSAVLAAAAAKAKNIRTIVGAVVALGGLFGAGVLAVQELRDKPTTEQVETAIEVHKEAGAHPAAIVAGEGLREDVDKIREDVDQIERVQDYQIEHSAWQGDVLQHVAERKRTKPPAKPESLKRKQRELLRK